MSARLVNSYLSALIAISFQTAHTHAADSAAFPIKPVRMVVPLAPGGGSDIVGRIVALALTDKWGQAVVVDNRPGAGGNIGNSIVAKSAADGYTLLVSSSTMAISPALYRNAGADIVRDFQPVTLLASQPSIIAIHPAVPAKSLKELIALMKTQPGKYSFGSAGTGTASHLANEQFALAAGVKTLHIPYKSAGLATTALLGGEIQFMVTNMATALPQVRAARLRGLAVTSTQRVATAPELPTAREAGLADYDYTTWYALLLPARTPQARVSGIHADTTGVLRQREVRERFAGQGLDVIGSGINEFSGYLKAEVAKWGGVVQVAGVATH